MKLTPAIKKKLLSFDFRYAKKVEGNIYKICNAKKMFPNATKPHILDKDHMCFWDDNCMNHACCIKLKNILIF